MSGTNWKMFPDWMAPNVVLCKGAISDALHDGGQGDTHHQTNEELESSGFLVGNEDGSIPKDQGNDEEDSGLGEGVQGIAEDGAPV
jgi:hypothetical protein